MNFTSIVIAGGAMKVISMIGCVQYLEEIAAVSTLKNYVGTSAGAIMCFFMVLGYKSTEIRCFLEQNIYDEDISKFDMNQIFNILSEFGLSDGSNIILLFERILYKKMKIKDITFIELTKAVGKNFVVCVSNLSKEKEEFFSVDTHPNMSVILALRASCSIPYLFHPIKIEDNIYVDGALYNNFAMNYFKDNKLRDIIGFNIIQKNYQKMTDIMSYSLFMIYSVINKVNKSNYNSADKNIITIDIEDTEWFSFNTLQLSISKETLNSYITLGYEITKKQLNIQN
jgi:predicted acylesterase/phospholipase RssA